MPTAKQGRRGSARHNRASMSRSLAALAVNERIMSHADAAFRPHGCTVRLCRRNSAERIFHVRTRPAGIRLATRSQLAALVAMTLAGVRLAAAMIAAASRQYTIRS